MGGGDDAETLRVDSSKMDEPSTSAQDYVNLLVRNRSFLALFSAEIMAQVGGWLNLIATLMVIEERGGDTQAVLACTVHFIRALPPSILWPLAGYLADSYDKKKVMIGSLLGSSIVAACFVLTVKAESVNLLLVLIFMKNALSSLFDPSRKAAIPQIVERRKLHVAITLDGVAWSSMLAIGAALGGLTTSKLGLTNCFILDACGYLLSCLCLLFLPSLKGSATPHSKVSERPQGSACERLGAAVRESFGGITRGSSWLPLVYATFKMTGGFVWAPADVLNFKFSEQRKFQIDEDQSLSLGLFYACIGVGCLVGPLIFNRFVGVGRKALLDSIIASLGILVLGYACWAAAQDAWLVSAGNALRAAGSAIIWIRSTVLLQLNCDQRYLGRLSAIEMALYTIAESITSFGTGLALDYDLLTLNAVCVVLVFVSILVLVLWLGIKVTCLDTAGGDAKTSGGRYERVNASDDVELK